MSGERLPERLSDERLVALTLAGDTRAFGSLVEKYWTTAAGIAFSRLGEANLAEDVAQESFIAAYTKLAGLRMPSRFPGWLSKIVAQKTVDAARRKRRSHVSVENLSEQGLDPPWTPQAADALSPEDAVRVRSAVARLPEKLRVPVVMRFIGGASAIEIAQGLGMRPSTVRVYLHRAYERLRKDLAFLAREV